jgi:O-antigen/teichoic acid export membrane protein
VLATPSSALDVIFQSRLRMGVVSGTELVGLLAQTALVAALAAAGGSLLLFVVPVVVCEVIVLTWKARLAHRVLPLRVVVDRGLWWSMLREAIPLTVGLGLATIYYRVDAIMLSQLDDFDAVGIYGVSYKFIDIVNFAATAVTVPLLTVLVRSWPDDLPAFREAVRRGAMLLAILGGMAAVGLIGFAEPLTRMLYGDGYAAGAHATQVLVVSQVLTLFASLSFTCLIAVERHHRFILVTLGGLVLNVGANLVLIPRFSYEGAAWATLGSEVVVLAVLATMVLRVPSVRPLALGRLLLTPVAVAAGVVTGSALDDVTHWIPAAFVAVVVFAVLVTAGGLTRGAGLWPGASRSSAPA